MSPKTTELPYADRPTTGAPDLFPPPADLPLEERPVPYLPEGLPEEEVKLRKGFAKAADLIEERGWTQGPYEQEDGRLCAGCAVIYALGLKEDHSMRLHRTGIPIRVYFSNLWRAANARWEYQSHDDVPSIIANNERDGQTAENMIDGLRRCARGEGYEG